MHPSAATARIQKSATRTLRIPDRGYRRYVTSVTD
jgi:hypothetical protein